METERALGLRVRELVFVEDRRLAHKLVRDGMEAAGSAATAACRKA